MKNFVIWCAAIALSLSLVSCEHKDLCYLHPHSGNVEVKFDWRNAPDAEPGNMLLWFYPVDGGSPVQFQLSGHEGGVVSITPGDYRIICLDGDHENILYSGESTFDGFEIATHGASLLRHLNRANVSANVPRAEGTDDQDVIDEPDQVYGDALETAVSVPVNATTTITMYPEEYAHTYEVEIRDVENLDRAQSLSGSLSGMTGSLRVADRAMTGTPKLMPFSLTKVDATTLRGTFLTFGHCPEPAVPHKVVVYAIMHDGAQRYQIYGDADDVVTPQIHEAADPHHVKIVLHGLNLPEESQGGGLMPSVDGWGDKNVDIEL